MVDIFDATDEIFKALDKTSGLVDNIRSGGQQKDVLPFLAHLRAVAREVDEAFADAKADLAEGSLGDEAFRRMYAAGSTHSMLLTFCQSLSKDEKEIIRLAGASGEIVLASIDRSPESVAVIHAMQERLARAD